MLTERLASKNFVARRTHDRHGVENRSPLLSNGLLRRCFFVVGVGQMERRPGDGRLKFWRDNFHAGRGFNRVKIDPALASIAHFSHALRSLEALDVGRERAVLAGEHDGVAHAQFAAVKDDVDGLAHADFVAHLEHGALSSAERIGQPVFEETFSQTHRYGQEVLKALAFFGRHGHQGHVLAKISNFVVALEVEPVLGKLPDRLPVSVLKQRSNVLSLCAEGFDERAPSFATPTVQPVDFVSGDDEGCPCFFEDVEGFDGLGLQAFHDVNHQDGDVRYRATSIS